MVTFFWFCKLDDFCFLGCCGGIVEVAGWLGGAVVGFDGVVCVVGFGGVLFDGFPGFDGGGW